MLNSKTFSYNNNYYVITKSVWVLLICIWVLYYSFSEGTLYGPVHSEMAIDIFKQALEDAKKQGGTIACGGKVREHQFLLNFNWFKCDSSYISRGMFSMIFSQFIVWLNSCVQVSCNFLLLSRKRHNFALKVLSS